MVWPFFVAPPMFDVIAQGEKLRSQRDPHGGTVIHLW